MAGAERLDALDSSLLAKRTHAALLEAIMLGRFEDKLPNEPDLAAMLNVSRTTLRVALQGLEKDGIITRRRAIGTTINRHVPPAALAIQRLVGFQHLLLDGHQGAQIAVAQVRWARGTTPAVFVETLELPREMECLICDKKYVVDERVMLWVRDIIPLANLKGEVELDDLPSSLLAFSEQHCVKAIDHAVGDFAAIVASDDGIGKTVLAAPRGSAFVRLHETFYSIDATVMAYGILDFDNDTKVTIFRRRD